MPLSGMSQEFESVTIKRENMIGFVPNSQPTPHPFPHPFPHRLEPTVSDYMPERHSMSSPILEIGTIVGNWTKNSNSNHPNDSNAVDLKKPQSIVCSPSLEMGNVAGDWTKNSDSNHPNDSNAVDLKKPQSIVCSPSLEMGNLAGDWTKSSHSNDSSATDTKKPLQNLDELKIYACHVCDYRTRQKQSLVSHQRNHTGEKPFACPHCSYKTGKPGNLTVHIRKHTGEKPYACDQCEYRGTQRISLINHKMTHSGEKPFICDVCDYRTSFRGNLSQHKRKHTGEKPFACGQCEYKSSQRTPWMAHLKKCHGNGPFICDLCGFSSEAVIELADHRKTHGPQLGSDDTSTVQDFANLNAHPLLAKPEGSTKFQRWPSLERPLAGDPLLENLPCAMTSSKPSPCETVEAFNTTLRWAIDNAKTMEEIDLLRRMRHRALEQYLNNTLRAGTHSMIRQ